MWILPKNYPLSSHFVADMVASKEDLTLPDLNIESSLMSRSKPTQLRTWQTRWKEGSYYQHLFGRILKPFQYSLFETKLTSLLAAIHVSPFLQQDSEKEQTTLDTCGLTLGDTSNQLDLFDASSRMSKDTLPLDCEKSLATWKALVTQQRGEYSARLKSARRIRESESSLWATPRASDANGGARPLNDKGQRISKSNPTSIFGAQLSDQVKHWPTPSARDHKGGYIGGRTRNGKVSFDTLDVAVQHVSNKDKKSGHLNPEWVEWLMGVPTGWTELGFWGTALCQPQQQKHGEC